MPCPPEGSSAPCSGTTKIKFNPTQVCEQMDLPVLYYNLKYRVSDVAPFSLFRLVNTKRKVINYRQEEKKILDRIIEKKVYDTRMRPKGVNSTRKSC